MPVSLLVLRQFPQFIDWPQTALQTLSESLELRRLTRRQMVITDNGSENVLGWVIEGTIWLIDHSIDDRECILGRYGPGEIIGELQAFGGTHNLPEGLNYMAATTTTIATLPYDALNTLIANNPVIAHGIIRLMAERSCSHFRWRSILALPSAVERVIAVLAALADRSSEGDTHPLPSGITQQEIAAYANTTRETVTRTMQRLQANGAALRDGNNWHVAPKILTQMRDNLG